jgi:hypothetical protein
MGICEISGSHSGKYEDSCLLGCCITMMMEAASTSEMSVNFYQTTWRNNPLLMGIDQVEITAYMEE